MTSSARTPAAPQARATSGTRAAGKAMTARSTGPGTSPMLRWAVIPPTASAVGCTTCRAPANPPADEVVQQRGAH